MSTPTLTTAQKTALHNLMKQYFNNASSTFLYEGTARRESYATPSKTSTDTPLNGCMDSSTNKYFLNCAIFAQMVWMGRNISDFTSNASPVNSITKAFDWGYYFDFLSARNAYGKTKSDGDKYSGNTYPNASGTEVFITFDNAAAMAEELYNKGRLFANITLKPGCGIGYHVHEKDSELFYLMKGEALYNDNGVECTVSAGDVMLCPAGAGHAIANKGEEPVELCAVIVYA